MFGMAEEGASGFDYAEAPERGWQEGKKDFTHKVGYYSISSWHYMHVYIRLPGNTMNHKLKMKMSWVL